VHGVRVPAAAENKEQDKPSKNGMCASSADDRLQVEEVGQLEGVALLEHPFVVRRLKDRPLDASTVKDILVDVNFHHMSRKGDSLHEGCSFGGRGSSVPEEIDVPESPWFHDGDRFYPFHLAPGAKGGQRSRPFADRGRSPVTKGVNQYGKDFLVGRELAARGAQHAQRERPCPAHQHHPHVDGMLSFLRELCRPAHLQTLVCCKRKSVVWTDGPL
jgi:hypothetical protein